MWHEAERLLSQGTIEADTGVADITSSGRRRARKDKNYSRDDFQTQGRKWGGVDECDDRLGRDPSVCPRGREAGGFTESPGLRAQIGNQPRILIKKMDANNAFRQVPVEPDRGAAFGYVLGQYLIVDLRLEFGWGGSPAW